jgi:hypothetical protein
MPYQIPQIAGMFLPLVHDTLNWRFPPGSALTPGENPKKIKKQ